MEHVEPLGLGSSLQKQLLGPKLSGVSARGASNKMCDLLIISATVKAKYLAKNGSSVPWVKWHGAYGAT